MKIEEIRGLSIEEMRDKIVALKKQLLSRRIELKIGKLEKYAEIKNTKKTIARLFTIIQEEQGKQVPALNQGKLVGKEMPKTAAKTQIAKKLVVEKKEKPKAEVKKIVKKEQKKEVKKAAKKETTGKKVSK